MPCAPSAPGSPPKWTPTPPSEGSARARPILAAVADRHSGRDARQAALVGDRLVERLAVAEQPAEAAAPLRLGARAGHLIELRTEAGEAIGQGERLRRR